MEPRYSSERVRFLITARCPSLGWITGGNDRFISVANLWRLTGGVGLGVRVFQILFFRVPVLCVNVPTWFRVWEIMPFVLRRVEPRFLCRGDVPEGSTAQGWPVGAELEAVANGALTTSLKQLASLLTIAEDIFAELTAELTAVADRSSNLRQRIDKVEERLATVDPKKVPVREYLPTCLYLRSLLHFRSPPYRCNAQAARCARLKPVECRCIKG